MTLLLLFLLYALALSAALAHSGHRSRTAASSGGPRKAAERVLIIGATGGTGCHLVVQALERGHTVTALVRHPSKVPIHHPKLTLVQGDVLDRRSLEAAMRGQEAVLSALGHERIFYPTRILSEGTRNVLHAMEAQGVRRLVCETSLGIGDSVGRMGLFYTLFVIPTVLPFYFWDKARQERVIAGSNVEWVIVRPGILTNDKKLGRYRHGLHVGSYLSAFRVARADVADFMLNQVATDEYLRAAPGICYWVTPPPVPPQ